LNAYKIIGTYNAKIKVLPKFKKNAILE